MNMLRTIVERVSRKVVLKRRLPSRVGGEIIFVSPDSSLKFWRRDLEKTDPALFNWATEFIRPGDKVWDVGANVGLFALAAASLTGPSGLVCAIEADNLLIGLLRRTAKCVSDRCAPIHVIPAAVSDSIDIERFNIAARGRSANYLDGSPASTQTGGVRETISVITITLDWLFERLPAPDVLKIDVEGAELRVLKGARNLLSSSSPVILCEVTSENMLPLGELLRSYGYTFYDLGLDKDKREPLRQPSFNTLARPPLRPKNS
jgi:FkbM family methyltransferase